MRQISWIKNKCSFTIRIFFNLLVIHMKWKIWAHTLKNTQSKSFFQALKIRTITWTTYNGLLISKNSINELEVTKKSQKWDINNSSWKSYSLPGLTWTIWRCLNCIRICYVPFLVLIFSWSRILQATTKDISIRESPIAKNLNSNNRKVFS